MIGMLWFDNDPKATLDEKIRRAVSHYNQTRGIPANVVYINPHNQESELTQVGEVLIKVSRFILPNHFCVGVEA